MTYKNVLDLFKFKIVHCFVLAAFMLQATALAAQPKQVAGLIEKVTVEGISYEAKLDTGADNSSIHAEIIEEKSGIIKFRLQGKILEKQVLYWANIKQKQRRPVVELEFCIAGHSHKAKVNLADRKGFNYKLLVGRSLIEKAGLMIDPAKEFLTPSTCGAKSL